MRAHQIHTEERQEKVNTGNCESLKSVTEALIDGRGYSC